MKGKSKHPGRGGARHGVKNATSMGRTSHFSSNTTRVDFEAINRAALRLLPTLLARWLPNGRRVSREYIALNPKRLDRHLGSFKIVVAGPRIGMWADFATGDTGGDVISLAAYLFGLSQTAAARRIADMLGGRHD
jgi:hypothetical protein